jgi:lia operon protein LiaG
MNHIARTVAGVVAITALVLPSDAFGQEEYRVGGPAVSIYNLAGNTTIVRGGGSDVVVRITRGGADAGDLEIATGSIGGRETLRVVYPDDRIVYDRGRGRFSSTVRVRSDGTFGDGDRRGGERVEIQGGGRGLEAWADLEIQVPAGSDLEVYVAVGEAEAEGVEGDLSIDTGAGSVRALDITGSLSVDTGSGSVFVRDVQGDLTVDTGSGGVEMENVSGTEVSVDTGSGSVEGFSISAEFLNVDTGSGGIDLREVSAPEVVLDTGSGSVAIELLQDVEVLEIDTGSGSVTVSLPPSVGAEVEIETGNGGIDFDFPVQIRRASRDHVVGSIGDGRGMIRIDTGSGSVRFVR